MNRLSTVLALIVFLFISSNPTFGQGSSDNSQNYELTITKITETITIDGKLEESIWTTADVASQFWIQSPIDGERAKKNTEVRMAYDDRFVYLSAVCWDNDDYIIQTLKRDQFDGNDAFGVLLDPMMEQTNALAFAVNAMGAQVESIILPNGESDDSWDNRWFVDVQRYSDKWTVEMAIPFKTLRYREDLKNWSINFYRTDPGSNETHVWAPIPRQFNFNDLGYSGRLSWDAAPKKQGSNVSLIPYLTARLDQNLRNGSTSTTNMEAGGDAKIAITPTLNLDLTYNPDFSQVEVDRQVTNLTRFNIFFPERRQFFLENADIFSNYGFFAERPFFSRRIGLDNRGNTVPILYGLRLSGNLDPRLRVGAFNMHTQSTDNQLAQNYTALSFQKRIWKRSAIKGIFLNRQAFSDGEVQKEDYGRNLGGEFNYSTPDGKWQAFGGYIHSLKEGFNDKNKHVYGRFNYNGQNFRTFIGFQHMGENYFSDMGFNGRLINFNPETGQLVRVGFTQVANMLNYFIYPKNSKTINFHWSGYENFAFFNADGSLNEWYMRLRHFFIFKNTSQLKFRLNYNHVDLVFPFAITSTPLPARSYDMKEINVEFNTDRRKRLNTDMFLVYGQFYGGTKLTYRANLLFRTQPWGNFALGLERNDIWLPDPYGYTNLTLASARVEINFATNLFWTTFFQYNTQANNFNINSRFQWRFAPMSDFFLVYTDNYQVEGLFGPKNRSLVFKVNYWLTL